MHPRLWKTLDLAHASYSSILWIIKEEIELKKKKTYYSPLRNRGESRSRSPRQKSLGRQQGWKVILNWTEPRVVIWTKSWKVYLSHITVGPYVVMWLFDEHLSPPLEHKLLQRVMGSVCCIHYCIPNA